MHDRGSFHCGKPPLDVFLRTLVSQYERRNLGRTFVAVRPGDRKVWGYYTLAAHAVAFQNLPPAAARKLPKIPIPVVLLARLAVDQSVQGQGLGGALLVDALTRCVALANGLGIHAVEVDAIDASAQAFYVKYGFEPLPDRPLHLYIRVSDIEGSLGQS